MAYYRPQTKFGERQCFYTCVSFCSQGGSASSGGGADPPPPILQDIDNKRTVRILLECILVYIGRDGLGRQIRKWISNPMDTLYYAELFTLQTPTRIPTPYFCIGQAPESESVPVSESGNVFKPLYSVITEVLCSKNV